MKEVILPPLKESTQDYEELESYILELFRKEFYYPLLKEIGKPNKVIQNAADSLLKAILSGQIVFTQGQFTGRFSAKVSKELRSLGAKWDQRQGTFKIPLGKLPSDLKSAIAVSESNLEKTYKRLDQKLANMVPEAMVKNFKAEDIFDKTLFKVDKAFQKNVKNVVVAPQLTPARRKIIAKDYTNNIKLYIQKWTEEEIVKLRKQVEASSFKGLRYESLVSTLQKSYGQSQNKAKFLARQETNLLITKFKQTRYEDAGVTDYIWGVVHMPKDKSPNQHTKGNVRYAHAQLDGKRFSWKNPPVTSQPGEPLRRNNPGQDYNCRCFAKPIVKF